VRPFNVLVTAGSRRVSLVHGFRNALRALGLPGAVIVTDVNPLSPAVHVADRAYRVPMSFEPDYLGEVIAICAAERIRLVVPTIDDELPIFAAARDAFTAHHVVVACSPERANLLCNDKFATCQHLRQAGVAAAETYLPADLPANPRLPLFIKPRCGRGAVGAFSVRSMRELEFFLEYVPDPVVQEHLACPEYTIDVLCDFSGRPLAIVPRERVVVRAGVIDRGRTVKDRRLIELAEHVCAAVCFGGPLNIQCRMRGTDPAVFEINPRFSGGISLTIQAGADFPEMLIKLALGRPLESRIGAFREELWMTSFETSFFVESPNLVRPDVAAAQSGLRVPGKPSGSPSRFDVRAAVREVA
jgi:carbamoyl-phosphate synthase large subunit